MSSVHLKKISKKYKDVVVVPDLQLEVRESEFLSLLGPSGCGKTTVLRMIAGLECPTSGQIQIGEQVVFDDKLKILVPPERRRLAMVFQSYAIWPHLSVLENVAFPLRSQKVARAEREERSLAALAAVRLDGLSKRRPHELSGGQQQRVALARALVSRPAVMLLDEPLSNLDANLRDEMCEELSRLKAAFPVTMIYVTHDQTEAFRLSSRIVLMNQGQVEQVGSPDNLRNAPKTDFVKKFLKL